MVDYEIIGPLTKILKRKRRKQNMRKTLTLVQIAKEIQRSDPNYFEVSFEGGRQSRKEELQLRRWIREVIRELASEIIKSKHEPMTASEVAKELLNIRNDILSSSGYLDTINKVIGDKTTPQLFVRDLLDICQYSQENIEQTISRLLSWDKKIDGLFWSKSWTRDEVFQICVQLASKYRIKDDKMKEFYKNEAISLLESGLVDFPDKDGLIQTLRRL
jgi:hypothetical protein